MFSLAYYISMFCMRKNLLKYSWEKICPNLCVFSELYLYFFVFYSLVGLSPNIWCFFQFHLNWIEKKSNGWQIHVFWSEERIGCQILSTYWLFFFHQIATFQYPNIPKHTFYNSRTIMKFLMCRCWVLNIVVIWCHIQDCNSWNLTLSDEIVSTLGEGTFGKVVEVKDVQK